MDGLNKTKHVVIVICGSVQQIPIPAMAEIKNVLGVQGGSQLSFTTSEAKSAEEAIQNRDDLSQSDKVAVYNHDTGVISYHMAATPLAAAV